MAYIFNQKATPHKSSHKETEHTRMKLIKNNTSKNPPITTAYTRVKIPINQTTPSPVPRNIPKQYAPTPIVVYEEEKYTPWRVGTDLIQGGAQ